jgi:hypothetical protein
MIIIKLRVGRYNSTYRSLLPFSDAVYSMLLAFKQLKITSFKIKEINEISTTDDLDAVFSCSSSNLDWTSTTLRRKEWLDRDRNKPK